MLTDVINMYASKAAFCRAIGMKEQFLTQIERGERKISPRYAFAIQQITHGAVTVHDLRPDVFGEAPTTRERDPAYSTTPSEAA